MSIDKKMSSFWSLGNNMKKSLKICQVIVLTSFVWLSLIFFVGGYYKSFYYIANILSYRVIRSLGINYQKIPVQKILEPLDPSFAAALKSMYDGQPQMGTDGSMHNLDGTSGIPPEEGMWIYELCRKLKPRQTLEIGLADGFSTIFFMAAIKANGTGRHVAIDPFEITDWHGVGLRKVQELGMIGSLRFIEEKDVFGLPGLAREGQQYEVIFIDGNHRFDDAILDFVLSDYVCAKDGYIIFDDFHLESIKKAVSFIENNRSDYQRQATPIDLRIAVFKKVGDDHRRSFHFVPF